MVLLNTRKKIAVKCPHTNTNCKDFQPFDVHRQKHFQVSAHFSTVTLPNKTEQIIACSTPYQSKAHMHIISIFIDDRFANIPMRPKPKTHTYISDLSTCDCTSWTRHPQTICRDSWVELYWTLSAGGMNMGPCLLYIPSDDSRCGKLSECESHHKDQQKQLPVCLLLF